MHDNAIDRALEGFASNKTEVEVTLNDGSTLRGVIKNFDGYVVFMGDGNGHMVYRHSLLKIAPLASERTASDTQPSDRPRRERFQIKPDVKRDVPSQKSGRPQRPRPQERRPQAETQEDSGHIGTMGEAMLKWLKSQKG